ncbi:MAG: Rrf2 family transcriptional regulator [Dehalococcoidales bacterium]
MKLSTRGRYGIRAMLDLAQHYDKGLVLVKDVAARQQISERYLEHLFLSLKTAGLVRSIRGARGGFVLNSSPDRIRLIEIVRASEGTWSLVECVCDAGVCSRSTKCGARDIWVELQSVMDEMLGSLTLQDLLERQQAKEANPEIVRLVSIE